MRDTDRNQTKKWQVTRTPEVDKNLMADVRAGRITKDDIDVIKRWTIKVEEEGPESLWQSEYWGDHPLSG